ncbi:MAG: aminotransferase class I/II-fold pyridoxal phosphate-dependent enzyme [Angustibacter sp.]
MIDAEFDAVDVAELRGRRTAKWTEFVPDVLPASIAEMDFPVADVIRRALHAGIDRSELGYAIRDLSGVAEVCADHLHRAHGWSTRADQIGFAPDTLDGLATALDLIAPPGSSVVVPTPAFAPLIKVIETTGRRAVTAELIRESGRFSLELDRIGAALAEGARTVLPCNPHNPTGRVFTVDELAGLVDVVDRHGARVVSDEVYAPLCFPAHRHVPYATVSAAAADHSITLVSASKGWNLAGLKCSQLVPDQRDVPRRAALRQPDGTRHGRQAGRLDQTA